MAKEKNFSKAARRLGISQPAVSLQLRELQKRYGVKRYTRRGKEIHLSHLGMQLVTTGRKSLGLLNEMNNTLTESADLLSGRLHICLSCHYFVKGLLARFMNEYPGVKVKASIGHFAFLLEKIQACRMNIAEVRAQVPVPGLYFLNFSRQQIILFVARTHARNRSITHVAAVHCETTTDMLNPTGKIGQVIKKHGRIFILDAMSSFGGVPMDLVDIGADFMISSANKCIQGVPGFGFVIAEKKVLDRHKARSLSLDLYDQWQTGEKDRENGGSPLPPT